MAMVSSFLNELQLFPRFGGRREDIRTPPCELLSGEQTFRGEDMKAFAHSGTPISNIRGPNISDAWTFPSGKKLLDTGAIL
jgi:hypothetical protein